MVVWGGELSTGQFLPIVILRAVNGCVENSISDRNPRDTLRRLHDPGRCAVRSIPMGNVVGSTILPRISRSLLCGGKKSLARHARIDFSISTDENFVPSLPRVFLCERTRRAW